MYAKYARFNRSSKVNKSNKITANKYHDWKESNLYRELNPNPMVPAYLLPIPVTWTKLMVHIHYAKNNYEYQLAKIKSTIENHCAIDAQNESGNTALMMAAREGLTEIVEILLANKAKIDMVNCNGDTAYALARANNHEETAKLLEETAKLSEDN